MATRRTYKVRRGQDLFQVARETGYDLNALLAANPGVSRITAGQGLNLPFNPRTGQRPPTLPQPLPATPTNWQQTPPNEWGVSYPIPPKPGGTQTSRTVGTVTGAFGSTAALGGTPRYGAGVRPPPQAQQPIADTNGYHGPGAASRRAQVDFSVATGRLPYTLTPEDLTRYGLSPEDLQADYFLNANGQYTLRTPLNNYGSQSQRVNVGRQFFATEQAYQTWLSRQRRGGGGAKFVRGNFSTAGDTRMNIARG